MIEGDSTMTTIAAQQRETFQTVLATSTRSPEIPESDDLYGWLIGSWELEVLHYKAVDVSSLGIKGEVHFGWVLEGRAVQDVWIMPRRTQRKQGEQHVWNYASCLGSVDSGLAHNLDESRNRSS
jgi:hypothetical protein